MKKKYIAVLLCAVLFCGLMGCASTEAPQNSANGSASLLQEATNWFESQTSKYEPCWTDMRLNYQLTQRTKHSISFALLQTEKSRHMQCRMKSQI